MYCKELRKITPHVPVTFPQLSCPALSLKNMPFLKKYTGVHGEVKFNSSIKVRYDGSRYVMKPEVCIG